MKQPILYIKKGCPHCQVAMDYLDQHEIGYQKINVRGDDALMKTLRDLSGQTRTPTLDWHGVVLADFGVDQLEQFLVEQKVIS